MAGKSKTWFKVSGTVTVSAFTLVKASSAEEAMELARGREGQLCPYGISRDGGSPKEQAIIEEGDGSLIPDTADPAGLDDDEDFGDDDSDDDGDDDGDDSDGEE